MPRMKLMTTCVLVSILGAAGGAFAGPVQIEVRGLAARVQPDALWIEYRFDPQSHAFLMQRRIVPTINVRIRRPGRDVQLNASATARDGSIPFRVPEPLDISEVEVWVTGGNGGEQVAWMRLGGVEMTYVALRVAPTGAPPPVYPVSSPPPPFPPQAPPPFPPPQQQGGWGGNPAVISSCSDILDGDANETQGMRIAQGMRYNPLGVLRACDDVMDGDVNELECLRIAASAWGDPSEGVRACDDRHGRGRGRARVPPRDHAGALPGGGHGAGVRRRDDG